MLKRTLFLKKSLYLMR